MNEVDPFESRMTAMLAGVSPAARALLERQVTAEGPRPSVPTIPMPAPVLVADNPPPPVAKPASFKLPPSADPYARLCEAFFEPLGIFIVHEKLTTREPGRIVWPDCEHLWSWFRREVAAAEIDAASSMFARGGDPLPELRNLILSRTENVVASGVSSITNRRRIASQVGGEDGYAVLSSVATAFDLVAWAANIVNQLPEHVTKDQIDRRPGMIAPVAAATEQRAGVTAWLYSALLSRLESPATLARIAVILANTDRDEDLSHSRHAPAIDILLSEVEICVERMRVHRELRSPTETINAIVGRYRHLVRQLSIDVDLRQGSRWSQRLATAKMNASAQLEHDVSSADGLTRQVLRTRLVSGAKATLDTDLLDDAERSLRILNAVTDAADVFTLNAAIAGARRDVGRAFEALVDPLINALRTAEGDERVELLKRCDGAIRLAGVHYGPEFEAILQRSRNVAIASRNRTPAAARP